MGDRSGGREPKGASLKKSKKNPGAAAARVKKVAQVQLSTSSAPPPKPGSEPYFDAGAALLSRQFDRDRDRVLQRGKTEGQLSAIVLWFSDIEKQQPLADLCKDHSGYCYSVIGIHPDNVDRTNKKSHESWVQKVEELGRKPECVGVLTGLNLGREMGTHFSQESLLQSSCAVANRLMLPIVLHVAADGTSLDRTIELLRTEGWTADGGEGDIEGDPTGSRRVILHDAVSACGGDVAKIEAAVHAGFYCSVSAAGITDPDESVRTKARACVAAIPLHLLLTCSDSPWKTPQNLPDPYLCTLRNEPGNLPSLIVALSEIVEGGSEDASELAAALKENSLRAFGMEFLSDEAVSTVAAASVIDSTGDDDKNTGGDQAAVGSGGGGGNKKEKNKKKNKKQAEEEDSEQEDHNNDEEEKEEKQPAATATTATAFAQPYFTCQKCRTALFANADILSHALDAQKTVFKVGDEGLCKTAIFLDCADADADDEDAHTHHGKGSGGKGKGNNKGGGGGSRTKGAAGMSVNIKCSLSGEGGRLAVRGNSVECTVCGMKLGKYSSGETNCPCGALVPGPTVRITTAKVDYVDVSVDTDTLAARSRVEAEESQLQAELEDLEDDSKPGKKIKKKAKIKSENRGNFSSFRNKSFIPNASRVGKKSTNASAAAGAAEGAGGDEDEESDEEGSQEGEEEEEEEEPAQNKKKEKSSGTVAAGNTKNKKNNNAFSYGGDDSDEEDEEEED